MTRIPLRDREGNVVAYALVDDADGPKLSQWRWSLDSRGYVRRGIGRSGKKMAVLLHRELTGMTPGNGLQVDHINRDKLDNRRSNLRVVDRASNAQNLAPRSGCKSRFRGVTYRGGDLPWRARVRLNGRLIHLGYFATEDEAGQAAREGREQYLPYSVECPVREGVA